MEKNGFLLHWTRASHVRVIPVGLGRHLVGDPLLCKVFLRDILIPVRLDREVGRRLIRWYR